MRKLKRSIARNLMEIHGVTQINKKNHQRPNKDASDKNDNKKVSFFSLHWREYLDPTSKYRKSLHNMLMRRMVIQTRKYGKIVPAQWPVSK